MFIAKFYAFIVCIFKRPIQTIGNIPENWRKVVFCTDIATPPDIVPGFEKAGGRFGAMRPFPFEIGFWLPKKGTKISLFDWIVSFPIIAMIFVVAIFYRWSLKSTALIWSPFVWAFRPIRRKEDATIFAKGIIELSVYKFARAYSGLVLFLFAVKIYVLFIWFCLAKSFQSFDGWEILNGYLVPEAIPLWHLTAASSACLTWVIYFRAERYLHRIANQQPASKDELAAFFKLTFVGRNILSIYTALCTLYITIKLASIMNFPALNILLLPWG